MWTKKETRCPDDSPAPKGDGPALCSQPHSYFSFTWLFLEKPASCYNQTTSTLTAEVAQPWPNLIQCVLISQVITQRGTGSGTTMDM